MSGSVTKIVIWNMALGHLGVLEQVNNEEEKSRAAQACRTFYQMALEELLRDYCWPRTTRFINLALVAENPTEEYAFSYRIPVDCLCVRRILSGLRNDNRQSRIEYLITSDEQGGLIYCDVEQAQIEYTSQLENLSMYTADFLMAWSLRLAMYIAPALTRGDPFKIGQQVERLFRMSVAKASANSFNEQQAPEDPPGELIRSRE